MTRKPVDVFFSYSHEDEVFRDRLEDHLAMLKRQGLINPWHDRRITPGDEWQGEIDANLAAADVILLLISANFLASDYCYDIEMARAMARHRAGDAQIIPILLTPVEGWQYSPFAQLQVLPTDGRPVSTWRDRNQAFVNVAQGISRAICPELPPSPGDPLFQGASILAVTAQTVPNLPPDEWSRREQRTLMGKVFDFLFEDR